MQSTIKIFMMGDVNHQSRNIDKFKKYSIYNFRYIADNKANRLVINSTRRDEDLDDPTKTNSCIRNDPTIQHCLVSLLLSTQKLCTKSRATRFNNYSVREPNAGV